MPWTVVRPPGVAPREQSLDEREQSPSNPSAAATAGNEQIRKVNPFTNNEPGVRVV